MVEENIFYVFFFVCVVFFGMNVVLYYFGYQYGGRLINNCYIVEGFENMNIWCKYL